MSRLLRSLELTESSCCWYNNISSSLRAITVAVLFVLWGVGSANAQGEFPCEISITCPPTVQVECGTNLEDFELTGYPVYETSNCFGDFSVDVTHADAVISEVGSCHVVITRTWSATIIGGPSDICTQTIHVVDTTGPEFDTVPADVTYQCEGDVPAQVELTATDACSGVDEVIGFDSETGDAIWFCTLTTPVGPGPDWAVWLNGLTALGLASNDYYTWVPNTATLTQYGDGTAYLTGDVQNMSNPGESWTVYFWMENGKNWADWSAMGRSYKDDLGFGAATHTSWTYYDLVPVFSHFVGTGSNAGSNLYLSHQPTNHYFGYQFGVGANNRNNHDGGSGWFYYWGWVNDQYVSNHGDLTTDEECVPVINPNIECNTTVTRMWRAVDACGNVTFADQDITVADTTPPVITNCFPDLTIECGEEIPGHMDAALLTATDNCGLPVTITDGGFVSLDLDNCTTIIRHSYYATDACANMDTCTYVVTIVDTTAPVITAPADMTIECGTGEVDFGSATAVDVCQGTIEVIEGEQEMIQDECLYHIVRYFSANDGCGNYAYATQTIWFTDTTDPVLDAYDVEVYVECDQVENVPVPGATDLCDESVEVTYEDITNSGGCLGVIMRTFTATDDCGNTVTGVQYIHIMDTTPPVVNGPADMTVECNSVPEAPGVDGAEVSDNCGMEVSVEFHTEMIPGECENSYTILWIWDATDYCELTSSDTTVITVVDTTNPELSVPQGGTFSCDEDIMYGEASATDNCDDDVTITFSDVETPGDCPQAYSITRTWYAEDNCGNMSSASTTYWVVDEEAPEFTFVPENITIECDEDVPASEASAMDNCGLVTVTSADAYEVQSACYTVIIRTFTATDECMNWTTATQVITIVDTTAPVITYEPELDLPCDNYSGIYATATDNCDESVEVQWINDEMVSGGCAGRIIRTYGAWDDCQNYSEVQQMITLIDETAPFVTDQSPDMSIECGDELPSVYVSFDDNCDDELSYDSDFTSETIDCITYITYTFTATDHCDNTTSEDVVITIVDTQDPYFIDLLGDQTINCDEEVPAIVVPTAYDVCDDNVEVEVADEILPGQCDNEFTVVRVYRAHDDCGNEAVETRYIYVVDQYAPVFDQQESEFSYECDDDIAVVTPTAADNCDENFSLTYSDQWESESDCFGFLIRTWTAMDDCGNTSYFYQYINIYDTTAPVITGEFEIEMPCDDIDEGIFVTATDNCDENVYITIWNQETASGGCAGRLIRTYRAWDDCENMSEFTQFITLIDEVAPVASVNPEDASYECDEQWAPAVVTFTDNCDMELIPTEDITIDNNGCTQVYHYVWSATDHCNNTTTVTQDITVTDTTPPTVGEPQDMTIECGTFWDIVVPQFSDNCDDELTYDSGSSEEMIDCNQVITFWWSATDNCDNTTYIDWVVTIEDTTPPMLYTPQGGEFSCETGITYGEASAYDTCDESVEVTFEDMMTPGDCPQSYTVVRTWTATDDCNNTATASATYVVYDNVAPEFTSVPPSMTLECSDAIPASEATAVDNCDEEVAVSQNDEYFSESDCYTEIVRTFIATDDCGNMTYAYQYFYIYDTTAPVVDGIIEIEMPCDEISYGIFVTATDNCDQDVYIEILNDELASGGCAGRIIRTYRAWDNCDNYTDFTQFITLTDETAPVASVDPEDMTVECGTSWSATTVNFTDNCDQELVLTPDVFVTATDCATTYHYIWTATDHCLNSTTVDQTITVVDTTAPMIDDENSESTVECNVIVDFVLPDAYDVCDEEVEVVPSSNTLPGNCPGEYTDVITFTATDDCGNTSSVTHIVHHVDNTAPTLENIPDGGEYSCDETLPNDMPTAFDYCSDATVMSSENIIPGQCPNSYQVVRTFWAVDECMNESEPVSVYYWIYDNSNPEFSNEVSDEEYQCIDWNTYEVQAVTATDNCGEAVVTHEILPYDVGDCGNGWWIVSYVATDLCFNTSEMSYWIHVNDTEAPVLSEEPASLMLDCGDEIPAAPQVTATDNCTEPVLVSYTETCLGDCPSEDGATNCDLLTPVRPVGNPCSYPVDWAMALFSMPNMYKWYQLVEGSGQLTNNNDGSITISGTLFNASPNAPVTPGGFYFSVTFNNEMDWAAWSSQAFPTGFKDDCGGIGANHEDWVYYLLQAGPGAELVGWGNLSGSSLDLTHAPTNNYFGFQYGVGANNYNGENGLGGWFNYHGSFLVDGEPIMSGLAGGAGDFAFEVDCCPDYQIVRCWSAMDCSGNEVSYCQTITFGDLNLNGGPSAPLAPMAEADKGEIAIVSIMPNPANEKSQISFMSKQTGRLSLQVMDMTGRIVADLYNNTVEGGVVYKADFNTDRIPSGMYMIRLNSGTESDMDRIQIAK